MVLISKKPSKVQYKEIFWLPLCTVLFNFNSMIKLSTVTYKRINKSDWALSWLALSFAECCPGQRWVLLRAVPDSAEFCWVLSRTALSSAEGCPGQRWVLLRVVTDSAEFCWGLSRTEQSQTLVKDIISADAKYVLHQNYCRKVNLLTTT